ncbi:hypothetical protein AN958_05210 [Leucoagaricus sp. SymC.cos]|nr:hypothetical protein AN958_05210 [Leucoagaricus sp. SymC.cos]
MWFDVLDSQSAQPHVLCTQPAPTLASLCVSIAGAGITPLMPVILRPPDASGVLVLILRLAIATTLPAAGAASL